MFSYCICRVQQSPQFVLCVSWNETSSLTSPGEKQYIVEPTICRYQLTCQQLSTNIAQCNASMHFRFVQNFCELPRRKRTRKIAVLFTDQSRYNRWTIMSFPAMGCSSQLVVRVVTEVISQIADRVSTFSLESFYLKWKKLMTVNEKGAIDSDVTQL